MSDLPLHSGEAGEGSFNPKVMLFVTAIGITAFLFMLILGAYSPDLRSGRNGGSHALSNASTGFSALVRLASETGRNPTIVRSEMDLRDENLAVITPDHGYANLGKILENRGPRATLVILPKWESVADQAHGGWVRIQGLLSAEDPAATLYPGIPLRIARARNHGEALVNVDPAAPAVMHFAAPAIVQTMSGRGLEPLMTTRSGALVLAKVASRNLYILSEPDLLNNHGMGDESQARAALAMLGYLNSTDANGVLFDVTANGLGRSRSPLKLAFDPPFLAVSMTLFAAMTLAAWQSLVRFGPVRRRERAIAFGKAALVNNSAALIRKAGREAQLGGRYVDVVRDRAIALFHLPVALDQSLLDARLEGMNPERSFAAIAETAINARNRQELLDAAQALNQWLMEVQQ